MKCTHRCRWVPKRSLQDFFFFFKRWCQVRALGQVIKTFGGCPAEPIASLMGASFSGLGVRQVVLRLGLSQHLTPSDLV